MSALGQAYTELYRQAKDAAWKRGFAAGWYAAQLEQAREQARSQPAAFETIEADRDR